MCWRPDRRKDIWRGRRTDHLVSCISHNRQLRQNLWRSVKCSVVYKYHWFVGCKFFKLELPHTKALLEAFRHKDFEVLQVCMKSDRETWKNLQNDFVGIPLYSNEQWDQKLKRSYKISGYPRYVLIDEMGVVLEGWCERPSDPALARRISDHFEERENLPQAL